MGNLGFFLNHTECWENKRRYNWNLKVGIKEDFSPNPLGVTVLQWWCKGSSFQSVACLSSGHGSKDALGIVSDPWTLKRKKMENCNWQFWRHTHHFCLPSTNYYSVIWREGPSRSLTLNPGRRGKGPCLTKVKKNLWHRCFADSHCLAVTLLLILPHHRGQHQLVGFEILRN